MIFQREPFADIIEEALPLMRRHYEEIIWKQDKVPLALNVDRYNFLASEGVLLCYTCRDSTGLKGYALFMLFPALHFSTTRFAMNDMIFITPESRGGTGQKFTDYIEEDLKALGAQVIMYFSRLGHSWGSLLVRKGYESVYEVWQKYIGED